MATGQLPTDQLDYIRTEIRAEIGLLNSRLNALIGSQSFLVIAYCSVMGSSFGEWRTLFTVTLPPSWRSWVASSSGRLGRGWLSRKRP